MEQKIVQYLNEAHASEVALVRVLQSQIAMTPRGTYRSALETHLQETRDHARRVEQRLGELGDGKNPLQFVVGVAESVIGQTLAIGKTPLDLLRGSGGEEKVLKNAKDAAATEALEIATYISLERLAERVGDHTTAELARSIRADEEKMLERIRAELVSLTDAVVDGAGYDLATTGAGEAVQAAASSIPGITEDEDETPASEGELPIERYDALSAGEIVNQLPQLSQLELAQIDAYERLGRKRSTVLDRVKGLRGDEPWTGYDELNAEQVVAELEDAGDDVLEAVRTYERAHKDRTTVLRAAEQSLTHA